MFLDRKFERKVHCICFNYLKLMNSILTNSLKWILLGQLICTPDDVTGDVAWRQFYGKTNAFDCKSSSLVALFQKLVSQTGCWCWGASERHFLGAKDLLWKRSLLCSKTLSLLSKKLQCWCPLFLSSKN